MTTAPKTRQSGRGPAISRPPVGRDRVVQVALRMFLRGGYVGTSMKSVAAELGLSAPAIYWYFDSKEDLFVAVMEHAMDDFVTFVRASVTTKDPLQQLGQLVRAHVTWQLRQSAVARAFDLTVSVKAVGHDVPPERLARVKAMELEYVQEFRRVLADGREQGVMVVNDVTSTAFAIITLCEYVHTWYRPDGRLTVELVASTYERMVHNLVVGDPSHLPELPNDGDME